MKKEDQARGRIWGCGRVMLGGKVSEGTLKRTTKGFPAMTYSIISPRPR